MFLRGALTMRAIGDMKIDVMNVRRSGTLRHRPIRRALAEEARSSAPEHPRVLAEHSQPMRSIVRKTNNRLRVLAGP
jgi:hypothetical protein